MTPSNEDMEEHRVMEMEDADGHGAKFLDFVFRFFKRKAKWWCPGCQRFHAVTDDGDMHCPFGNDIDKEK